MAKAKTSFWLDGGYDYELVRACPKHRARHAELAAQGIRLTVPLSGSRSVTE